MFGFIQQKVKVFISSKCGGEYTVVRKALKKLLEETNLCFVYAFEEDYPTTQRVVSSYLNELQDSDLVIFLIDNFDGVSGPVQSEIDRARELHKKCLFLFCDERSKVRTQLQQDIFCRGLERTKDVHEFSDLTEIAYNAVIKDILRVYRSYCFGGIGEKTTQIADEKEIKLDIEDSIKIEKKQIKGFVHTKSILKKRLTIYIDKQEEVSEQDQAFANMLEVVIGDKDIFEIDYDEVRKFVMSLYDRDIQKIMAHRLEAIYQYWSGNIEATVHELKAAIEMAKGDMIIPRWLIKDIVIDLRNVQLLLDESNGIINLSNEGQKILDEDSRFLYNPVVDRVTADFYEAVIDFENKRKIQSPFTVNFGGVDWYLDKATDIFIMALQCGSITHILMTRKKLISFLVNISLRYREHALYVHTVKWLILDNNSKMLKEFVQAYGESTNHLNGDDVLNLYNAVEKIKIPEKRFMAESLLLHYFGYYMEDELFLVFSKNYIDKVIEHMQKGTLLRGLVSEMLLALENAQYRLSLCDIMKVCYEIFEKEYKIWYNDVFKLLRNIYSFDDLSQTEKRNLVKWIKKQLNNSENINNCRHIGEAAQNIRQNLCEEAKSIDDVVQKSIPQFFEEIYALNVFKHDANEDWAYIKKILLVSSRQNKTQGKNGVYFGSAGADYITIANIVINDSIILNAQQIRSVIYVLKGTLLSETQSFQVKCDALYLLTVLQLKHKQCKQIKKLLEEVQVSEVLWEGKDLILSVAYSKELLIAHLEVLRIFVKTKQYMSIEIVPLILSLDTSTKLTLLNRIYRLICINNRDGAIERLVELLWPVLLVLEESDNAEVKFEVGIIYAALYNSNYQERVFARISAMLDEASYKVKVGIISRLKNYESDSSGRIEYFLQKGKVDNHYWVRKVSNE